MDEYLFKLRHTPLLGFPNNVMIVQKTHDITAFRGNCRCQFSPVCSLNDGTLLPDKADYQRAYWWLLGKITQENAAHGSTASRAGGGVVI